LRRWVRREAEPSTQPQAALDSLTTPSLRDDGDSPDGSAPRNGNVAAGEAGRFREPVAAARAVNKDAFVAGLDVSGTKLRVERIGPDGHVVAAAAIVDGVQATPEAALRLFPAKDGVALVWHGLRGHQASSEMMVLDSELRRVTPSPVVVGRVACGARAGLWSVDGDAVRYRPWEPAARSTTVTSPPETELSLVCSDRASYMLSEGEGQTGSVAVAKLPDAVGDADRRLAVPRVDLRLAAHEPRHRAAFISPDGAGVVELDDTGALTMSEVRNGSVVPNRTLKTRVSDETELVAVEANASFVVIVLTEERTELCAPRGLGAPAVLIEALRVNRADYTESRITLASRSATCGREVGPFFLSPVGPAQIAMAWVERQPVIGESRAPIAAVVHGRLGLDSPFTERRVDVRLNESSDPWVALADGGCDDARCVAVAFTKRAAVDGASALLPKVVEY